MSLTEGRRANTSGFPPQLDVATLERLDMKYRYNELCQIDGQPTIRLLELLPGDGPINIHLKPYRLDTCPKYEALSYNWGSSEKPRAVLCEGRFLFITESLFSILPRLRSSTESLTLWIDAICINQEDRIEKSKQIQLMTAIYGGAYRTIIWLGQGSFDSEEALKSCVAASQRITAASPEQLAHYFVTSQRLFQTKHHKAVSNLLQRPWFRRIWILQEILMSERADLVCGNIVMPCSHLFRTVAFTHIQQNLDLTEATFANNSIMIMWLGNKHSSIAGRPPSPRTLLERLVSTRRWLASDPRDKVFALTGVVTPESVADIKLDYDISIVELYKTVAVANLKRQQSLYIISIPRLESGLAKFLPSWAPDWSDSAEHEVILASPEPTESSFTAASDRSISFTHHVHPTMPSLFDISGSSILVKGLVVGQLSTTGPVFMPAGHIISAQFYHSGLETPGIRTRWRWEASNIRNLTSAVNIFLQWYAIAKKHYILPHCDRSTTRFRDDFWATATCRNPRKSPDNMAAMHQERETYLPSFHRWMLTMKWNKRLRHLDRALLAAILPVAFLTSLIKKYILALVSYKLLHVASAYLYQGEVFDNRMTRGVFQYTRNRRFGIVSLSSGPTMALLPPSAGPGDTVALFAGSQVPIVIRRAEGLRGMVAATNGHDNAWQVVGECYVHGIMEGEAWDSSRAEVVCLV